MYQVRDYQAREYCENNPTWSNWIGRCSRVVLNYMIFSSVASCFCLYYGLSMSWLLAGLLCFMIIFLESPSSNITKAKPAEFLVAVWVYGAGSCLFVIYLPVAILALFTRWPGRLLCQNAWDMVKFSCALVYRLIALLSNTVWNKLCKQFRRMTSIPLHAKILFLCVFLLALVSFQHHQVLQDQALVSFQHHQILQDHELRIESTEKRQSILQQHVLLLEKQLDSLKNQFATFADDIQNQFKFFANDLQNQLSTLAVAQEQIATLVGNQKVNLEKMTSKYDELFTSVMNSVDVLGLEQIKQHKVPFPASTPILKNILTEFLATY